MDSFFGRYKNPLVLTLVLFAQFFLLAVQVRRPFPAATAKVDQEGVRALRFGVTTVVTPPESVLHKGGLSLRGIWSSYLDLVGVRQENVELKEELDQLRMEQAALAEDARQGERLQDLLAFRQHYIDATVPAQVIGTSGTDRSRVLYLDKGSDDGLAADQPVITPDGIVGRVREVYPHTAQVLEISDPTSAAGVLLEETRTRGILRGNTQGQPQIVNLMPDDRIKRGQLVLTSGGDQIYPRGLPVGVVDHIAPDLENEPMVNVVLKPAANLSRLEEVLVVTSTGAAPTDRARHDLTKSELVAAGARAAKEAAAAQAVADAQRASDVLAQRLPSRYDQSLLYAPDATADASPATSEAEAKPLHPLPALHPDHYSPTDVPSAQSLTPGQRYAPLVEGTPATERQSAKSSSSGDNANATDASPVEANAAFRAATAAVAAQRKAIADAKAADAARAYAATHPSAPESGAPASPDAPGGEEAGANAAPPAVHYTERVNADGTVTRVAVPAAAGAVPAVRYVTRVNADGTTSRVAVPTAPAGADSAVHYVNRTNADGTVTRVALPGTAAVHYTDRVNADGTITRVPLPTPATTVRYVDRTNADGTVTRVAVPATPPAGTTSAVRYTNRVNADGTITRVPIPATSAAGAAAGTAAVHYVNRTNADGTVTRVAVPATNATTGATNSVAAVHYVNRTNADGTVTRVAVPAKNATTGATNSVAAVHYVNRTNADGTVTRVPVPATNTTGTVSSVRYVNRTNADGTVTRVAVPSSGTSTPPTGATSGGGVGTAIRYTTRVNADGTTTRVPVPPASASPARYTTRVNADGTVTRVPVPAPAASTPSTRVSQPLAAAAKPTGTVPTRVISDGPLPAGSRSAPNSQVPAALRPAAPTTTGAAGATTPRPAAPKRKAPEIVPDDGSRPPAHPAATQPATTPQGNG